MTENILYYGDNLEILRRYIKDETVDLIYLDPPFKSNQDYNVLFAEQNGSRSAAQIKVFEDTWEWNTVAAAAYQEIVESGHQRVSQAMQAFRTFLGESDMMAYLAMMAPRLVELHRVLKPTGSIYLHCDTAASHYLKMLMDAVFSSRNFRNEIIWCYRGGGRSKKDFGRKHDVILRYTKTNKLKFYSDSVRVPYQAEGIGRTDDSMWGRHKGTAKVYKPHPKGKVPEDWWAMDALNANSPERLGYPTQKPEMLLERIIKASTDRNDIVLDPFCGCGTTIAVAQKLKRRWIGIDITHLAVALMKHRLEDMFGEKIRKTYEVVGEPTDLSGAKQLAKDDPYQFQWWALGLVGARPVEQKKGADKGIDGRLYFHDEPDSSKAKTKQIILSVKAGHVTVSHVRDLRGVVEREKAAIGALISIEKPTKPMRAEATTAGFYKSPWQKKPYPRLQIITIEELLNGKRIDCPPLGQVNVTFKKAPKAKDAPAEQKGLDF
ncbi:MAG: restriction endonuclease [candidate division Zixibacteria bacterium]|nr:restriction endonuclease [candidate division Zixibacteria bacterium]